MSHTSPISIDNTSNEHKPVYEKIDITDQLEINYKGDEFKQRVAEILGVKDTHGWVIEDTHEHLALVHYSDDDNFNVQEHGHLRGVLVDTEVGAVIANSFGYTPTHIAKSLHEKDGFIAIKNEDDEEVVYDNFPVEQTFIKRVFEGVVIRVIWHKGQAYRITHKKIKPLRSRWGSSPTFLSMYEAANGPTDEQLFDTTKPYSSTCYTFLVCHPALLVGTRQRVESPYIICLAQFEMNINRPSEEVAPGINNFERNPIIKGTVSQPFIHDPQSLSIQEADHHLRFGYYNSFDIEDPRQLTGEAVIIYRMVDGEISDIVKVHSPSFDWRTNMRGNNSNIPHQFYCLLNTVYKDINCDDDWSEFKKKYILFPLYDEQSLKDFFSENNLILTIPEGPVSREMFQTRNDRIHLLWMNYVLSLHPSVQKEALNLLSNFHKDRSSLISFIIQLETTNINIDAVDLPDRYKSLIKSARNLARNRVRDGNNYSNGSYIKLPVLIKTTIRNLVNKENGPSLYALIRHMKNPKQPKQTNNNITK